MESIPIPRQAILVSLQVNEMTLPSECVSLNRPGFEDI
jgi:hypothetical protein